MFDFIKMKLNRILRDSRNQKKSIYSNATNRALLAELKYIHIFVFYKQGAPSGAKFICEHFVFYKQGAPSGALIQVEIMLPKIVQMPLLQYCKLDVFTSLEAPCLNLVNTVVFSSTSNTVCLHCQHHCI